MKTITRRPSAARETFLAPYESRHGSSRPVPRDHGGYGVLAEGYINGPFMLFENAVAKANRIYGGRVVRWVDFITESTSDPVFRMRLAEIREPLTCPVYAPGQLAPVVWRE